MRFSALSLVDASLLAALHHRAFSTEAWSQSQIEGSLALPTTCARGVWVGEELAGFAFAQIVAEEAEILTIAVDPAFQRHGLGRALMQDILNRREQGAVFLEVAADNKAAIGLYESCGFQLVGRRAGYYKREKTLVDALNYRYLVNG